MDTQADDMWIGTCLVCQITRSIQNLMLEIKPC